jgi:hypothetical protein
MKVMKHARSHEGVREGPAHEIRSSRASTITPRRPCVFTPSRITDESFTKVPQGAKPVGEGPLQFPRAGGGNGTVNQAGSRRARSTCFDTDSSFIAARLYQPRKMSARKRWTADIPRYKGLGEMVSRASQLRGNRPMGYDPRQTHALHQVTMDGRVSRPIKILHDSDERRLSSSCRREYIERHAPRGSTNLDVFEAPA